MHSLLFLSIFFKHSLSTFFELFLLDDTTHKLIPEKGVVFFELSDLVLQLCYGSFVELLFLHYL